MGLESLFWLFIGFAGVLCSTDLLFPNLVLSQDLGYSVSQLLFLVDSFDLGRGRDFTCVNRQWCPKLLLRPDLFAELWPLRCGVFWFCSVWWVTFCFFWVVSQTWVMLQICYFCLLTCCLLDLGQQWLLSAVPQEEATVLSVCNKCSGIWSEFANIVMSFRSITFLWGWFIFVQTGDLCIKVYIKHPS